MINKLRLDAIFGGNSSRVSANTVLMVQLPWHMDLGTHLTLPGKLYHHQFDGSPVRRHLTAFVDSLSNAS